MKGAGKIIAIIIVTFLLSSSLLIYQLISAYIEYNYNSKQTTYDKSLMMRDRHSRGYLPYRHSYR